MNFNTGIEMNLSLINETEMEWRINLQFHQCSISFMPLSLMKPESNKLTEIQ